MRKLSKYEKETIINWNEAENLASIYTFNASLKRRLADFSRKYPLLCRLERSTPEGSVTYVLDKSRLSIRLIPPYSEERKAAASAYAREHGFQVLAPEQMERQCSGSEGKKDTPGRSGRSRKGSWIMWRIIEGISEICSQRGPGRSPGGTPMLPSCSFWETEKHRGGWKRASAGIQIRMWNKMKVSGMKK